MGFIGQAALHRATLGRVQQRAGDPLAASTYERAIRDATACGDGRLAATARLNLARLHRGLGDRQSAVALLEENERWYASAGGGDYALLSRCILCCEHDDVAGLQEVLRRATEEENHEVELFALDGLARLAADMGDLGSCEDLLARADSLAATLIHVVDDGGPRRRYRRSPSLHLSAQGLAGVAVHASRCCNSSSRRRSDGGQNGSASSDTPATRTKVAR